MHDALPDPANDGAPDALRDAAQAWVVRLASGEMDESEFDALAAWRAQSPEQETAFAEARRVWQRSGGYRAAFREQDSLAAGRARRGRGLRRAAGALAATLVLAVAVPAALGSPLWAADYEARGGVPRRVTLADGSVALLDAGAALDFSREQGVRRVDLRAGTAFFKVAHDAAHPFKVYGGDGVATAVGTQFAVRRDGHDATVSVTEGRVYVESGGAGRTIGAGVEASWHRGAVTAPRAFDPGERLAWCNGRLVIEGMRLDDALHELQRYDAGYIVLLDRAAASRRVSGVFSTGDARTAVGILARTQRLGVRHVTPFLTIVS